MTIAYHPKMNSIAALFFWKGTILQSVLFSSLFWLIILIHCVFLWIENRRPKLLYRLDYGATGPTLGLSTFFLVFYGGSCYSRFYQLWGYCVGMSGAMMEFVGDVKIYFSDDKILQWNLCRLMLAAYQLELCILDEGKHEGVEVSDAQYRNMQSNNLLSTGEIETIKKFNGFKPFLPMMWALDEVRKALPAGDGKFFLLNFRGSAYAFRTHCQNIIATLDQPVPFPYFHVLKLMLVVSLLILSYAMVQLLEGEIFFSIVVFFNVALVMFGLEAIAIDMADPFGDDDTDFDTDEMMRHAYEGTVALLRDTNEHKHDATTYGDGIGNPVLRQLPSKIAEGTTLAALVRQMGSHIEHYDWSHYTLEDEARTYGSHSATKQLNRKNMLDHASTKSPELPNRKPAPNKASAGAPQPPPQAVALPPPPPPSDLPPGWESATDPSSGKTYFVHRQSGTTQWERPQAEGLAPKVSYGSANGQASMQEVARRGYQKVAETDLL